MAAKRSQPVTPRPAATVILLRRGGKHKDRGLEVCLALRNPDASFMPGVWVFPGGSVEEDDGEGESAMRACAARELNEEVGVEVDPAELVPYSRWITPEIGVTRFDTSFYLALAPPHSPPRPDGHETVDSAWFGPQEALDRHYADQLPLVFPTIKHLESLRPYRNAEEALAAAAERAIVPVTPRVEGEGEERRIVLPDGWGDVPLPKELQ
jgi:8-oxo-dGTP pyrophosphatase MutT (NUDIX family)